MGTNILLYIKYSDAKKDTKSTNSVTRGSIPYILMVLVLLSEWRTEIL